MENTITLNGIEYIPATQVQEHQTIDWLTYCIIRTYSAGVRAWYISLENPQKIWVVKEARRLRKRWSDFTLSALAVKWAKKGKEWENKYAMPVNEVYLTEIIEIIPCSKSAMNFIKWVPNYIE